MSTSRAAQIVVVQDAKALAERGALEFAGAAIRAIAADGRFLVALSGGSTPKAMFELLAGEPWRSQVQWDRAWFFWGDERCVPPDHPDSNYRAANELLLSKVPVDPNHVLRIRSEADPAVAAREYSEAIRSVIGSDAAHSFHLVLLGMGPDGHTASLFPGTPALHAAPEVIAVENYVAKFGAFRITLTANAINHAERITFLVGGAEKAPAVREVLEGDYRPDTFPSQLIKPASGKVTWILDRDAASMLAQAIRG